MFPEDKTDTTFYWFYGTYVWSSAILLIQSVVISSLHREGPANFKTEEPAHPPSISTVFSVILHKTTAIVEPADYNQTA